MSILKLLEFQMNRVPVYSYVYSYVGLSSYKYEYMDTTVLLFRSCMRRTILGSVSVYVNVEQEGKNELLFFLSFAFLQETN